MIEDQKYYSHPIYRNLIKFIWIIVIALQVRQEMFALGLALNFYKCLRSFFQCPGSRILGPI